MTDKIITFVANPEMQLWLDDIARSLPTGNSPGEAARSVIAMAMEDDKAHPEGVPFQ